MKKIIIDEAKCTGCGTCIPQCKEGAIRIVDGKARVVAELCDGAGVCIGRCPRGAISFEDKEPEKQGRGGPGTRIMSFKGKAHESHGQAFAGDVSSELTSWPVQLRLVPPLAPFLENADLLIAADCVPCAYAGFHRDLLAGKALLVGCPKFDDMALYKEKLESIIKANTVKSVTCARMEVPCCAGLGAVIKDVIRASGKNIPFHGVVITIRGDKQQKGNRNELSLSRTGRA